MSKEICVFLADGFEEIEALTVVDLLRRAGALVTTVSISKEKEVTGSHHIEVIADALFEEIEYQKKDMLVLPGGMPGAKYLGEHRGLEALLRKFDKDEKYIAAICAAPRILGKMGLLKGKRAASYPSVEDTLAGAEVVHEKAVISGHIITSRGLGTAIDFALLIIRVLFGEEKENEIRKSVIYNTGEA